MNVITALIYAILVPLVFTVFWLAVVFVTLFPIAWLFVWLTDRCRHTKS